MKRPEMTEEEVFAHGSAVSGATTEAEFKKAVAAYVQEVVERETDPYDKIAEFVWGFANSFKRTLEAIMGRSQSN